jgi:hypothetical protein
MGYMKSVDVVLTAHKLSEAQKNAVVELLSGGFNTAKPNTIKSLENKGLVINKGDFYLFEESFRAELKAAYSQPEAREEESVESLLQGDPWKMGDAITEDEAFIILDSDGELKDAEGTKFDTFDSSWTPEFKVTAGFGETLKWRGTEVWDGLTAEEIREDMDTAYPAGRQARRVHHRTLRNAFRRMAVKASPESRKSIKITGKVGV